jgi:AraC-like DNA-binding protein
MSNSSNNIYLNVVHSCFRREPESYIWGPGVRDLYIIHYVYRGKGFFVQDGRKFDVSYGQCFLITPNTLIEYYPNPDDPWNYAWIELSGAEAKKILAYSTLSYEAPVSRADGGALIPFFKESGERFCTDTPADRCRNVGYARLILAELIRMNPSSSLTPRNDPIVTKAVNYIDNNYHRHDLTVDRVAAEVSINRVSLHRYFSSELGISPKAYISNLRVEKAKSLLSGSKYSIKSIAYSVGFSDSLYFCKAFKKNTGLSPSEFRNSLKRK